MVAKPSILEETKNLIRLYLHHAGDSEIPPEFHLWCCVSMIAACVANRIWLEKFRGKPLYPNLYTALLGPSGIGKGEAIDTALQFVKDNPRVNVYNGKASPQHLIARLGKPVRADDGKLILESAKNLFLVTPELSMSLGKGESADSMIKHMTELYTGRDYPLRDGTITRGEIILRNHCFNWILGTTEGWLMETITVEAVVSGFFARIIPVRVKYNLDKRLTRPVYPADYDVVVDYLRDRIGALCHLEGPVTMTAEAQEAEDIWYTTRPAPSDESLIPAWKREHDLSLKLAMIAAVAEDVLDLVIRKHHIVWAQKMTKLVSRAMPGLVTLASTTADTTGLELVKERIHRAKQVQHSVLLRAVSTRGINAERLRGIIDTLTQSREIKRVSSAYGTVYVWGGRSSNGLAKSGE